MAITKVSPGLLDLDSGITITTSDNTTQLTLISTDSDANSGPHLALYRNSGSAADGDDLGRIYFYGENDADQKIEMVLMRAKTVDASDGSEDSTLQIYTYVGGAQADRLTLNSTETVLNESSKDVDFRVESDGNANGLILRGSDGAVGISTSPNAWETGTGGRQPIQVGFGSISGRLNDLHTEFTNNAYAVGTGNSPQWAGITRWSKNQIALGSNGEIYFNTSPAVAENTFNSSPNFSWTNMLTLQSTGATLANGLTLTDGDLTVASGHGINFAATGGPTNGAGSSELLDDYEEGTWTATLSSSGGSFAASATSFTGGTYTKIGNMVTAQIYTGAFNITNAGSGYAKISGLPFTALQSSTSYGSVIFYHTTCFANPSPTGYVASNTDFTISSIGDQSTTNAQSWKVANSVYFMVQVQYTTAS